MYYIIVYYIKSYHIMFYYIVFYCIILYCIILYCIISYYFILYIYISYLIILYYSVLYYIISYFFTFFNIILYNTTGYYMIFIPTDHFNRRLCPCTHRGCRGSHSESWASKRWASGEARHNFWCEAFFGRLRVPRREAIGLCLGLMAMDPPILDPPILEYPWILYFKQTDSMMHTACILLPILPSTLVVPGLAAMLVFTKHLSSKVWSFVDPQLSQAASNCARKELTFSSMLHP